ncbi:glutathione S-transferase family protein [Sagittula stellata]|uniref:Glutathione S-transferase family protein n=1 Tax=Sagittula stellata (strain ATCC 700073 / DSM 11524 / E-37) TaxID=388399 RepID=A3KBB1_SAGS3|nr:glutathione S-transferase [Sagittula stellata]EBA05526.1 glutathione S-transferase family protein [Sagittula stellata E-37]
MSYVLHHAPDNASLIVRLALEELGVPYETRLVDRATRAQESAAYRRVNPAGLIPALETSDGVLFETAAILLWLADRHGRLAPAPCDAGRGDVLKWLVFVSNTVHTGLRMTFYPEKYVGPDPQAQAALLSTLRGPGETAMTLPRALALLDGFVATRDPDRAPDVLDLYVTVLLRWCALYPQGDTGWFRLGALPALEAMAQRLETRPSLRKAALAEGLGPTPFSNPRPAQPPEGSAL